MEAKHFVFDGFPPEARFVEVETPAGRSISAGTWNQRTDGLTQLIVESDYADGYSDGVDDALTAVRDNPEAILAVRKFCRHWIDCPVCQGTGKNLHPTQRDIAMALLVSLGARGDSGAACRICHGEKAVAPAHAIALFIAGAAQ